MSVSRAQFCFLLPDIIIYNGEIEFIPLHTHGNERMVWRRCHFYNVQDKWMMQSNRLFGTQRCLRLDPKALEPISTPNISSPSCSWGRQAQPPNSAPRFDGHVVPPCTFPMPPTHLAWSYSMLLTPVYVSRCNAHRRHGLLVAGTSIYSSLVSKQTSR